MSFAFRFLHPVILSQCVCSSLSHVRFFVTLLSLSFPLHILTKRGSGKNVLDILTEILVKHRELSHN